MPKASEIKKGSAISYQGNTYIVRDIERSVPQGRAGGSIYRMRMYDVVVGTKRDESFKDSDVLSLADLVRKQVMFSYIDNDEYVFMDKEDYTPYHLKKDSIEDEVLFISESTDGIQVVIINDVPVGLELPAVVELEVTDTAPCLKGASATSRNKPATLSSGLTVQVPENISVGDKIRVNVEERRYSGRA